MSENRNSAEGDRPRRGRKRSARSHQAVLAATMAVLEESGGYAALTMEAVAVRAGVSRATIYRWWPSRAALVIEALDATIPNPPPVPTGDSRADVRTVVQATVDRYLRTSFGSNLAMLAADAAGDPDATVRLADLLGPRRSADASVLLAAAAHGDLPHDVDVHLLLDVLIGTLIFRALVGVPPDDRIVDQLTDLIVAGHLPRTLPRTRT